MSVSAGTLLKLCRDVSGSGAQMVGRTAYLVRNGEHAQAGEYEQDPER